MTEPAPDAARMTPLAEFLAKRMTDEGWDLRDVTRPPDGVRPGGPARSTMSWHLQPERWLKTNLRPATVKELATGVRSREAEIRARAWRSMEANKDLPELDPNSGWGLHEIDVGDNEISVRLSRRDEERLGPTDVERAVGLIERFLEETGGQASESDWLATVDELASKGSISKAYYEFGRAARDQAVADYERRMQEADAQVDVGHPDNYATAARHGEDDREPPPGDEGS